MVIWLRNDDSGIGIDADVVRREELAMLTDIDHGFIDMQQHGARLLAKAHRQVEELIGDAEKKAGDILVSAQRKFDNSSRLGYASGNRKATDEMHSRMLAHSMDDKRALTLMQERMADIVVKSVGKMVGSDDRGGLFQQAAKMIGRELAEASFLTVTVHPSDASKVRAVFLEIAEEMHWSVHANIVENMDAKKGDCLCEWDYGVLDAGLSTQLQALRRSVKKILKETVAPSSADDTADAVANAGFEADVFEAAAFEAEETQDSWLEDEHEDGFGTMPAMTEIAIRPQQLLR
jgi:type III secretion protein L